MGPHPWGVERVKALESIPGPVLVVGGAAALVLLYLKANGAGNVGQQIGGGAVDLVGGVVRGVVEALPEEIRPTSDQNLIYRGVNAVGGAVSGEGSAWTLGGWIYDITH